MSKNLSFKLGQETERGVIRLDTTNPNEGQVLFGYSKLDTNIIYPYKNNVQSNQYFGPEYDARIYLDCSINGTTPAKARTPISSYFSDYSSKLWDLSSGEEFTAGNYFNSIYFNNGIPKMGYGTNIIYCSDIYDDDGTNNRYHRVAVIDAEENEIWLYDNDTEFKSKIPFGTCFLIDFFEGWKSTESPIIVFSENETVSKARISLSFLKKGKLLPEQTFVYCYYDGSKLYEIFTDTFATTEYYGQIKLYDNFDSTATDLAATANSVYKIVNTDLTFTGEKTFNGNLLPGQSNEYNLGLENNYWNNIYTRGIAILGGDSTNAGSLYTLNTSEGDTSVATQLTLGNSIASGNSENRYGIIQLYGQNSGCVFITADNSITNSNNINVVFPNESGNITISEQEKINPSIETSYKIPFYTNNYKKLGLNDGLVYNNKSKTTTENGFARLILGDNGFDEDGAQTSISGQLKMFNNNGKATTLMYDDDEGAISQTVKYRYYDNNLSPSYLITTPSKNAVGGKTKIEEVPNGDQPVYISNKGVATTCDGIVVTEGKQIFSGEKTFNGAVIIKNETVSTSSTTGALIIKGSIGVAKTSYMASIYPGASRITTYTLGSASNIWSGVYSQYNYLFGSSGNNYTKIKTEDTPSSSVTVTIPNIAGNVTISKTSNFENDGDSVKYYKIPFYTTDYKEIGMNDGFRLWQYKGSTDKADEGISALTLGNDKPSETLNNKYGAVNIYSIDSSYQSLRSAVSETGGVTYLRNYGTSGFLVATAVLNTAVGGETKIGETINGDIPVYISETGLATACNGIVVTEEKQTFSGRKIFSTGICIDDNNTEPPKKDDSSFVIGNSGDQQLRFYQYGIQSYANDNRSSYSELYLNEDGGDIYLGSNGSYLSDNGSSDRLWIEGIIETSEDIICGGSISSGNIYPASHNQWNIGNNTKRWQNIYIADYVNTGALILGNTGSSGSQTTTIGYSTGSPETVVSSPVAGRVYFQIID